MKRFSIIVLAVITAVIFFTAFSGYADSKEGSSVTQEMSSSLPTVGNFEHFKKLVEDSVQYRRINGEIMYSAGAVKESASTPAAPAETASASPQPDYSKTNVQVEGVDESDIVKTDGSYIYEVTNQSIAIVKAYPAENMELESTIRFDDISFYPGELYVDGNYLIVTGQSNKTGNGIYRTISPAFLITAIPLTITIPML